MNKAGKNKPGKIVTIYTDPVTCENDEGFARLVKLLSRDGDTELWVVSFLDEPDDTYNQYDRTIQREALSFTLEEVAAAKAAKESPCKTTQ